MLRTLQEELELGYLSSFQSKITKEVFTDLLDMGEHFITEGYYDAAAVMIGGVLEGHLKKLCETNEIPLTEFKDGKELIKGANWLNDDLRKKAVYDKTEFKAVNILLEIRNDAAHTDRPVVEKTRVQGMLSSVRLFLVRYPLS